MSGAREARRRACQSPRDGVDMEPPMKRLLLSWLCIIQSPLAILATPLELPTTGLAAPRQPQVAAAADGTRHVVFGDGTAIYATRASGGDTQFAAPVKIADLPKLALGMRRGPRITATGRTLVVTAISHADGNVHSWLSADAGKTWRTGDRINTIANSAREGLHAMAADGRGLVSCVWLDLRGGGMELWSRVSRDGGAVWEPEVRVYASPDGAVCTCCVPSVAIGPRGEIAAMWRNVLGGARDMWTASSTDGGRSFGAGQKIGAGTWKLPGCPMDGGGLAFAPDGTLTTTWRREGATFTAAATGSEAALATASAQPLVVSTATKVATLWEKGGALWMRVDADAARRLAPAARMASVAPLGHGCVAILSGNTSYDSLPARPIFQACCRVSRESEEHRRDDPQAPPRPQAPPERCRENRRLFQGDSDELGEGSRRSPSWPHGRRHSLLGVQSFS